MFYKYRIPKNTSVTLDLRYSDYAQSLRKEVSGELASAVMSIDRSEEHTSELQSPN